MEKKNKDVYKRIAPCGRWMQDVFEMQNGKPADDQPVNGLGDMHEEILNKGTINLSFYCPKNVKLCMQKQDICSRIYHILYYKSNLLK